MGGTYAATNGIDTKKTMANFEDLRMADLVKKFKENIENVAESGSLSKLREASPKLQDVYNFHLTAHNSFSAQEENLKNMYSSFNYAALICNQAAKSGGLGGEDRVLLTECIQILLKCCDLVISSLTDDKKE